MLPQDFADQDPRIPSQLPRLVVSETRQALISCVAVPPRWLGTDNEQTVPREYIEALLRQVAVPGTVARNAHLIS